jgi:hypothetical protein
VGGTRNVCTLLMAVLFISSTLKTEKGSDDEIKQDHRKTVMSNCDIYFQL